MLDVGHYFYLFVFKCFVDISVNHPFSHPGSRPSRFVFVIIVIFIRLLLGKARKPQMPCFFDEGTEKKLVHDNKVYTTFIVYRVLKFMRNEEIVPPPDNHILGVILLYLLKL